VKPPRVEAQTHLMRFRKELASFFVIGTQNKLDYYRVYCTVYSTTVGIANN
jgi:hypothetical protein